MPRRFLFLLRGCYCMHQLSGWVLVSINRVWVYQMPGWDDDDRIPGGLYPMSCGEMLHGRSDYLHDMSGRLYLWGRYVVILLILLYSMSGGYLLDGYRLPILPRRTVLIDRYDYM